MPTGTGGSNGCQYGLRGRPTHHARNLRGFGGVDAHAVEKASIKAAAMRSRPFLRDWKAELMLPDFGEVWVPALAILVAVVFVASAFRGWWN